MSRPSMMATTVSPGRTNSATSNPPALNVDELFAESLTSDSGTDLSPASMAFPSASEDNFPMQMNDPWTMCIQGPIKPQDQSAMLGIGDLSSQDDYYFDSNGTSIVGDGHHHMVEPKKARRQAQNRAAQRAFRERKEKYIQELEEKTMGMSKKITNLESERKRLEGALRVARAEVNALKSLPSRLTSQSAAANDRNQIACKIETPGGKHTVVLTLEIGVQGVSVCQQEEQNSQPTLERARSARSMASDMAAD